MSKLAEFWRRLLHLGRKSQVDQELAEEMRQHLEMKIEANLRAGMSPVDARYAAQREFGNQTRLHEESRELWGWAFIESFFMDLRYGARSLRRNPGFTAVAILTLALGIGANTAIFSVVNGILIEPLVYTGSPRLVEIGLVSFPEIREIQEQSTVFERMAVYQGFGEFILGGGAPTRTLGSQVSADFFPMLGVKPLLGRPILPEDTQANGSRVAVLSYGLWKDFFGGDSGIVGRGIVMNQKPYTVVGVMPKEFELGSGWGGGQPGAWTPLAVQAQSGVESLWRIHGIVARLREGVTLDQANAQLKTLSTRLAAEFPKTEQGNDLTARSLKDIMVFRVRTSLLILLGAVGFVLLIACVNVSALLVARAWTRQKEVAIRRALGATRGRIVRQLLTESVLLALAGGTLGLLFSAWGIRAVRKIAPPNTPRADHLRLDGNVLWFALGISLFAAILFGLAPALQVSSRRVGSEFKKGLSGSFAGFVGRQRRRWRGALVIVETALAVILVIGAALMMRSFEKLIHLDTGVRTDHVLTMHVQFDTSPYNDVTPGKWPPVVNEVLDRIRSLEGVQRAAMSTGWGLQGGGNLGDGRLYVQGVLGDRDAFGSPLLNRSVTPGYFDALGIRLLSGRDFDDSDWKNSPPVAIVSRSFARAYIPGNPLGKRFRTYNDNKGNPVWMQIVGMVNDTRDRGLQEIPGLVYYMPLYPTNSWDGLLVRTSFDPMAMAAVVRQQVWAVDKKASIEHLETMDQVIAESVAEPKFQAVLLGSFGVLGLFLAAIGIYGLISYSVVQRTHEIGVRMALGAQQRDVMRLVIGQGAGLALAGIVGGLFGAWALTRVLRNLLYDIKPTDPATFAGVAILLFLVALLACYIPARRATRVDPLVALRYE